MNESQIGNNNSFSQPEILFEQPFESLDLNVTNQTVDSNNQNNNLKKVKGNKTIIFVVLGVLLISALAAGYFFFLKPKSAKQVFDGVIDFAFGAIIDVQKNIDDSLSLDYKNKAISVDSNITLDLEFQDNDLKESIGDLKGIKFDVGIIADIKNNELSFNVLNSQNDKDILSFEGFIKDKTLYFNSNIFKHPYKENLSNSLDFDEESLDIISNIDFKVSQRITSKIQKYLKESIKDEYLIQEKGKYTVDGHSIDGYKTTLKLNNIRIHEIETNLCELATNDEEFLKDFATLSGYTIEKVKSLFIYDNIIPNDETNLEDEIIIDFYTKASGKFLGFELTQNSNSYGIKSSEKMSVVSDDNNAYIKLFANDEELIFATYDIKTKEFKTTLDDINLAIKLEKNGFKITISNEETTISISLDHKSESNKITNRLFGELESSEYGFKGNINVNESLEEVSGIKTFDVSKATLFSEISDYQLQKILENVLEKLKGTYLENIYTFISSAFDSVISDTGQSAFAKEGMSAIDSAKYALQIEQLNPSSGITASKSVCMDIEWLNNKGYYSKGFIDSYKGSVLITYNGGTYSQKVWLSNRSYLIENQTVETLYNNYSLSVTSNYGVGASTNCGGFGYDILCSGNTCTSAYL